MHLLAVLLLICGLAAAECPRQPWTWWKGLSADATPTLRVPALEDPIYQPMRSNGATAWVDPVTGDFWLYGGLSTVATARRDELWRWRPATQQWAWMGDATVTSPWPPDANLGCSWYAGGALYMFGGATGVTPGTAFPGKGVLNTLASLWRYNITSNAWTQVVDYGVRAINTAVNVGVFGSANFPGVRWQTACALDSQGVLWMTHGYFNGEYSDVWALTDYETSSPRWAFWGEASAGPGGVVASSTHPGGRDSHALWIDRNDRLWIYGGNDINALDLGDMWYIDLRALTPNFVANWTRFLSCTPIPPATNCPAQNGYPGSRSFSATWTDATKTYLHMLAGRIDVGTLGLYSDLWQFEVATTTWTRLNGPPLPVDPSSYYNQLSNFSFPRTSRVANLLNTPGGRRSAAVASSAGVVHLYGGYGYADGGIRDHLPDLWSISPVCVPPITPPTAPPPTITPPPVTTIPRPTTPDPTKPPPTTQNSTTLLPIGSVIPIGTATVVFDGPFVVLPGTVIEISPGGLILVNDCATLSANVTVSMDLPTEPTDGELVRVLSSNCTTGPVPSIVLRPAYKESCKQRAKASPVQQASSGLAVLLTLSDECSSLSYATLVGIIVGSVALIVVIIILAFAILLRLGVVSLRKRRVKPNFNSAELYAS